MESEQEFQDFIRIQVEKLKIDKWIEGERICSDPGIEYEFFWIEQNAKNYKNAWNISKCKSCGSRRHCGYNTLSACDGYIASN